MSTIQGVLEPAIQQLRAAGSPSPILDAQLLLGHICGLSRSQLLTYPEKSVTPAQTAEFSVGVSRLIKGEPLPYLIGQTEFYGLPFHVTSETLIPRPETEHLVDVALQMIPDGARSGGPRFLVADVGTGSGCIAVSLALHRPRAHVLAVDISRPALGVAQHNANRHRVSNQVTFLEGDLLVPLIQSQEAVGASGRINLIVANLPYVADDEWDQLPVGIRQFEPAHALCGGPDGLDLIAALMAQGPVVLAPGGAILLEIGASQGVVVQSMAYAHFPQTEIRLLQDYAGKDRLLVIQT